MLRKYRDSHSGVKTQSLVERPEAEFKGSMSGQGKRPAIGRRSVELDAKDSRSRIRFPAPTRSRVPRKWRTCALANSVPESFEGLEIVPDRGAIDVVVSPIDPRTNA